MIGHLKINRAIATRYDKLASSFLDMLHLAASGASWIMQLCKQHPVLDIGTGRFTYGQAKQIFAHWAEKDPARWHSLD